jgi:spore coat polysaccharide biosynthesis protein SpsF (cytidylyltransferase family)
MTTVAIVQARMNSTRLPGKMMRDLSGKSVIHHVLSRVKQSQLIDNIVLATTTNKEDIVLLSEAAKCGGINLFTGDEKDVLARYYNAALLYKADVIVRITGDCPVIDPDVIDSVITLQYNSCVGYASNVRPPTYPDGLDVEVFSMNALALAYNNADSTKSREHVTPYMWRNGIYAKCNLRNKEDLSEYRLTLDEEEDLIFLNELLKHFNNDNYRLKDIMNVIYKNPKLLTINNKFKRNEGF